MLIMKAGFIDDRPRPLAETVDIKAGEAGAINVLSGQLLKITALGDGAVASLFGFSLNDPKVWLSVHHTRVFSNSYLLGTGMRMVSNVRRPIMVLGKDTVRQHDLLLPGSTSAWLADNGYVGQQGCIDSLQAVLSSLDMQVPKIPDPINLFMHTRLHRDGRIEPLPNQTRSGDSIICRVISDTLFVVSACCTGIAGNDRPAPLQLAVAEDLPSFTRSPLRAQ